ncbi:hypothetical protein Q9L42_006245 [Methylomarinum sp. Ch1-1]|uniref:Uncharacterized protein n=1 Tax=Methylomarinum roseum TaxID=3067653 RepID=A0AAU7NXG6_9GAMM|nr:hypothetical protein [Methylomarinum sp. Ch1-1]MDP4522184.1 hypothetical protein [Methylomarinum sp. Ch1-1]
MMSRIHMQDQVHNRIQELMNEAPRHNWDEILQNIATLALVTIFMTLGLCW